MIAAHNASVGQLTEELESQLMLARERREKCEGDVSTAQREWEETQGQMEEDLDGEIEVSRIFGDQSHFRLKLQPLLLITHLLASVLTILSPADPAQGLPEEAGRGAGGRTEVQGRERHHEEEVHVADEGH